MRETVSTKRIRSGNAGVAAFLLTCILCAFPHLRMSDPIPLLAERFLPGSGWIQIIALSVYAAVVAEWLVNARNTTKLRMRLWLLFSIVFFAQAILGVLGVERLLMTGKLHLPVPAIILAGPLYRGEGFFMPVLLLSTLLVVGPAWCSWLCYAGAWDNLAASARRPAKGARSITGLRIGFFVLVVAVALALRWMGVGGVTASVLGGAFGLVGVGVMVRASRRRGIMVHCTTFCPIGLVSNLIGRINPFRIRIGDGCDECRACTASCRYAALGVADIRRCRAGFTCTLCGDCLSSCNRNQIYYRFPGLAPDRARRVFLVLVAALHAVFLGFARI